MALSERNTWVRSNSNGLFYGNLLDNLKDIFCAKTFCSWMVLEEVFKSVQNRKDSSCAHLSAGLCYFFYTRGSFGQMTLEKNHTGSQIHGFVLWEQEYPQQKPGLYSMAMLSKWCLSVVSGHGNYSKVRVKEKSWLQKGL